MTGSTCAYAQALRREELEFLYGDWKVAGAVKGGLDRGAAVLDLNEFSVGVLSNQQGCVGMPQIVEADFAKARTDKRRMKFAVNHVIRVNWVSVRVADFLVPVPQGSSRFIVLPLPHLIL